MIPFLASTNEPVRVPHPPDFRPLGGPVHDVFVAAPNIIFSRGLTDAQRAGLRYEEKVQEYLFDRLGHSYRNSPQIHFYCDMHPRVVVPDGIYRRGDVMFVFEIKLQHMPEAWWQLRRLYVPVLSQLSYVRKVYPIEVCRTYDPSMPFPEPTHWIEDIEEYVGRDWVHEHIGVHVWRT